MALTVGTNSYVDASYAESYFEDRFHDYLVDWADIDDDSKDKLLITATGHIDGLFTFSGEKADESQVLEFPRYDPENDSPVVPDKVKQATCELALFIYNYGSEILPAPESIKMDKMKIDVSSQGLMIPAAVSGLLKEYGDVLDPSMTIQVVNLDR